MKVSGNFSKNKKSRRLHQELIINSHHKFEIKFHESKKKNNYQRDS
jgi:hypothetical protein